MSFTTFTIIFFSLIFLSAIFSGAETAFFSLNLIQRKKVQRKNSGKLVNKLLLNPQKLLITILFGNTILNVALTSLNDVFFENWLGSKGFFISVFFSLFFLLFIGEITPKVVAVSLPEFFSLTVVRFINIFSLIVAPFVFILYKINNFLLFSNNETHENQNTNDLITREEFHSFLNFNKNALNIKKKELHTIERIINFADVSVKKIKTVRTQMVCIPAESNLSEIKSFVRKSSYTRFPIYRNDIDNIIGFVNAKDLIPYFLGLKKSFAIETIARSVSFVPEQQKANTLLREMIKKKEHIIITINEFGSVSGLVTLEDLFEEIVGEIYDEWDVPIESITLLDKNRYFVIADITIEDFNRTFNCKLSDKNAVTIAGYILNDLGRLPVRGETIIIENLTIEITSLSNTKIIALIVNTI